MPLLANFQQRSLCLSLSTFTQKLPDFSIACHVVESTWGRNPTRGGSSDTDVNDPILKPTGSSPCIPVTIVTPVGKCPSGRRL